MKNWLLGILSIYLLSGCDKNEEVVPRTNPRFSVAFVQEVSETGAQFAANVYDFGSDEILEYGFVYSENADPKVTSAEVVKATGRPDNEFRLVGDHSMVKGRSYYVSAFIKTEVATVYSEAVIFKSEGALGFLIDRVEGEPEVYYGDTLTVYGSRLSTDWSNYSVKVNQAPAQVIDLQQNSFKIIIPNDLEFGYPYDYDGKLILSIKVLDKQVDINSDFQFYEPVFFESDRDFTYEENFYIKGKYLRSRDVIVSYPNYNMEVVSVSDSLIVFNSFAAFETLNPTFRIQLRGKIYEVDKSIRIQKTEIDPGQKVKMGSIYSYLVLAGSNFNSVVPFNNYFVSDVEGLEISVNSAKPDSIWLYSYFREEEVYPRFFKVWANNAGVKSDNYASVENTWPVLPYMRMHTFPFNPAADGRSVNWGDKGIWLLDGKITQVDPQNKTGKILKYVDINQGNIASSFAVIHQDVVYFAGSNNTIANTPGKFYSFNLTTGSLTELPAIPSKASTPRSVFIAGGYLYFGGGYYIDEIDIQKVEEGYRFNLSTKTWSKWNKTFKVNDYWDFETTFEFKGQVYGFVNEINDNDFRATRLMRFDKAQEDWVELARYPYLGYSNGNVAMPIGNSVYVLLGDTLRKLDMTSYRQAPVKDIYIYNRQYTGPPLIFLSRGKIFYSEYNSYMLREIDPAYIRD